MEAEGAPHGRVSSLLLGRHPIKRTIRSGTVSLKLASSWQPQPLFFHSFTATAPHTDRHPNSELRRCKTEGASNGPERALAASEWQRSS